MPLLDADGDFTERRERAVGGCAALPGLHRGPALADEPFFSGSYQRADVGQHGSGRERVRQRRSTDSPDLKLTGTSPPPNQWEEGFTEAFLRRRNIFRIGVQSFERCARRRS